MVARTICSRRTGLIPTFGLTGRLPIFLDWPTNYDGAARPASSTGVGSDRRRARSALSAGGGARSRPGAPPLGGPLSLQTLQRHLGMVDVAHRRGERAVARALGDEPVHRL